MNKLKTTLLFILVINFTACKDSNDVVLTGGEIINSTWINTYDKDPSGTIVNELIFDANMTFTEKTTFYGYEVGLNLDEASAWYERKGIYTLDENKIFFTVNTTKSWDISSGSIQTDTQDYVLFQDCTYQVNENTLILSYITYPADAPMTTMREYLKSDD